MIKSLLNKKIGRENKKGFTLAELLIVVAIIGVLVAISIPIFSSQLEKSREATDLANIRSAYASLVADYLDNGDQATEKTINVPVKQKEEGWQNGGGTLESMVDGEIQHIKVTAKTSGDYTVTISADGKVTVD